MKMLNWVSKNKNIIYFTFIQFYVFVNIHILVHIIICLFAFFFFFQEYLSQLRIYHHLANSMVSLIYVIYF